MDLVTKSLFRLLLNSIRESLGQPIGVQRFVNGDPDLRIRLSEPERVVAASNIVQWHRWGDLNPLGKGILHYWSWHHDQYESLPVHCPALENIVQCQTTENWCCDISDIAGVSDSKSNLLKFRTLDDMVMRNSPEMIREVSDAALQDNLAHREIRIIHSDRTSDYFARYLWDGGRTFLMNSGGSHHFAAARYISSALKRSVPLSGLLRTYSINADAVSSLCRDFDMFALPDQEIYGEFLEAMRSFRASFSVYCLPWPHDHASIILLPKSQPRSMCVSAVFRDAGLFDVVHYLGDVVDRQLPLIPACGNHE